MQVVSVKAATDVDVQTFVKGDDPNKLPSLLKITQTEITNHEPLCTEKRYYSERDPKHEVGWALVKRGICSIPTSPPRRSSVVQIMIELLGTKNGCLWRLAYWWICNIFMMSGLLVLANLRIFVMELMTRDLRRSMTNKPQPLTGSEKIDIIIEIAKGMTYIHSKGYAHGDLKCSSIVVSIWK